MIRNGLIPGVHIPTAKPAKCESCVLGKQTWRPVPKKHKTGPGHKVTRKLEKVWVDLSEPHTIMSQMENLYTMGIIDGSTDILWTIPLKTKDEAFPRLKAWKLA